MKKLLTLLLLTTFLFSCSSDDDNTNDNGQTQDYTSFIVVQEANNKLTNIIVAYYKNGSYSKIENIGHLSKGQISKEITVGIDTISQVYIFSDYIPGRLDTVYSLKKNTKNILKMTDNILGINVDVNSPQYPK